MCVMQDTISFRVAPAPPFGAAANGNVKLTILEQPSQWVLEGLALDTQPQVKVEVGSR
jgi:hypothetical protein